MTRPSTPELARRIVDRVLRTLETNEALDSWWYSEYGAKPDVEHELIQVVEKELQDR
jgi:hypothetical protein